MTQPGGGRTGPDPRFMVPYEGSVTKRDDPEGRGRIKLVIPGLIEPETPDWVMPIGGTGGTATRGHIEPPDINANVVVIFIQGNPDKPRFLVGPWGAPQGASDAPSAHGVEGDDKANAVTEDAEWTIERDSRSSDGHPKFEVTSKSEDMKLLLNANPLDTFIELNTGSDQKIEMKANTGRYVIVESGDGQKLELKGPQQQANLDSGAGPALLLDSAAQTVSLQLGSGPILELFAGGFALSAGSPPEFAGIGGKAKVGDRNATEKMMLGTAYRADEAAFLEALCTALQVFALACSGATIEPTLGPAATALNTALTAGLLLTSKIRTDAAHVGYLSQNVDVQD